ncbi:MAG: prolyl oligopeptidase family serine peptidase, partial [Catenulispora sp.]|nr:prolyl oligopeptidase family serine peptidase [Catenulispora sp.]
WERFAARPLAALLCVATAGAAGLVAVNHELELFGTWSEVVGAPPPTAADGPGLTAAEPGHGSGSRIVSFTVHGRASHITLPVYAYLPPGYQARGPRLPVIEALDGFPGSPQAWLKALAAPAHLDEEIAAHRMPQTVVLFPYQTVDAHRDLECTDAVGGPAMDTFLTTDVPAVVGQLLRVRTDAASWGLIGYSAGGFCSVNLALRHPDRFAAAASLSGYFEALTDSTTGDLYHGDRAVQNANSPLWRVASLPVPPLSLYLATAQDDHFEYSQMEKFAALAKPPLRLTLATVPLGGHSKKVWRQMEGPAFDWLAAHLAGPLPDRTQPDGTQPGTLHSAGKAPGVSSASTAR